MEELTFRSHKPTQLKFGTSGLRGLVTDITDLEAYINTRGFLRYILQIGDVRAGDTICIAGDLRPSTDSPEHSIMRAVAQAIADSGLKVENLGKIPTPALMHYALVNGRASIMITGSHIPFDRNGIKFNKTSGEILKTDEPGILAAVADIRREEYGKPDGDSRFGDDGMFKSGSVADLPPASDAARAEFCRRYESFFPNKQLSGKRIVYYQHSGVGRDLIVELLRSLGAEVFPVGRSEQFIPIDTEAISDEKLAELQTMVDGVVNEHGSVDALLSTDGDSDRPLLVGVTGEGKVKFFGGDLLGIMVASYLGADSISVPISANDALDLYFAEKGIEPRKTKIGSPFVIASMIEAAKTGAKSVVGWEANGGFLTGSDIEKNGAVLRALPTRDSVLPLLATLHASVDEKCSLVELFDRLPARFSRAGLIDEFPREASLEIIAQFSPADESLVEATSADEGMAGKFAAIESFFTPELGFGKATKVNLIDGLRITFDNGEIAHIRPSGNAPQLRLYSVADSQERANDIVDLGLKEPDGILRKIEASLGGASDFTSAVISNIRLTSKLIADGATPEVIGTVCGSTSAQQFWQKLLDETKQAFRARAAISFHEDLPTNQAFGLLLLWQRLKEHIRADETALVAFVFGDGTRSTPITETDNAQKPAIATYVKAGGAGSRQLSMVELAMRYFIPVQQYLTRSGFKGLVVKWGDEVQIPTLDLSGSAALFESADIVRFVSICEINDDEARNKDWVGVDEAGRVTAFIPRRPLAEMEVLADRGLVQRRDSKLFGGVNLGSIGVSFALLEALLEEFRGEVNDASANRKDRPALDPEFFTALTIAVLPDTAAREEAWNNAVAESGDMKKMAEKMPDILERICKALSRFQEREGRSVRMVAMNFGSQYWGDVGQHAKIFGFYKDLNDAGDAGEIARAMAGIDVDRDENGNLLINSDIASGVEMRNSVLIDAKITGTGKVTDSVLLGTRVRDIDAQDAFDVMSVAGSLKLGRRAGSYKVVDGGEVVVEEGERLTTLFLPGKESGVPFRVREDTNLKDKARNYSVPVLGNALSFEEAHKLMGSVTVDELNAARGAAIDAVLKRIG